MERNTSQIFYEESADRQFCGGSKGSRRLPDVLRWPNRRRNLGGLPIAGGMGVIWQSAVSQCRFAVERSR